MTPELQMVFEIIDRRLAECKAEQAVARGEGDSERTNAWQFCIDELEELLSELRGPKT